MTDWLEVLMAWCFVTIIGGLIAALAVVAVWSLSHIIGPFAFLALLWPALTAWIVLNNSDVGRRWLADRRTRDMVNDR